MSSRVEEIAPSAIEAGMYLIYRISELRPKRVFVRDEELVGEVLTVEKAESGYTVELAFGRTLTIDQKKKRQVERPERAIAVASVGAPKKFQGVSLE